MNFLDTVFGETDTNEGKIARELGSIYWRTRTLGRLTDRLLPEDEDEELAHLDRRLSIAMKQRALGLPMDTDDLDAANNSDTPFMTQMTTLAGTRALQAIPSPGLLQGAETAASRVRLPWEASHMARGAIGALSAIGGKYVSPIGRFFR